MLVFPMHPRYARMLLAAGEYGCVRQVALIAALTQGRELLVRRQGRAVADARDDLWGGETQSDFFVLMRAWRYAERCGYNVERCRQIGIHAQTARQVGPLLEQFLQIAEREGLNAAGTAAPTTNDAIQRCVLLGFSDHVARRLDAGTLRCALVHGRRGVLARESVVTAPLLVAAEVAEVQGRELNVLLSLATAVREEWLRELFPEDFREAQTVVFDTAQRRVVAQWERRFRDLILEQKTTDDVPAGAAARLLAQEVAAGRLALKEWTEAVEQWIVRVNRLREWLPESGVPAITTADRQHLLEQICHGATSYKEIKDRAVWPVVKSWLSPAQQQAVEQQAPERIELPGGRRAKLQYAATGPPVVAARIQDLYGVKEGLWIAQRRVAVRIEVLAPNHRPVQVTENLAGFWKETYPRLKQELQRKYPKHEWR
jgi:ATP-dependent helicase HrpB